MKPRLLIVGMLIVGSIGAATGRSILGADAPPQPSAREVLERAREAMTPPVQYRMSIQGSESIVSQKVIGEQGVAVRTETIAPGSAQYSLVLGGDMYRWTAGSDRGFRLTGLLGGMLTPALAATHGATHATSQAPDAAATVTFVEPTTIDGEECLVVEEVFPVGIIDTLLANLPVGGPIPRGTRSVIGKRSGRFVETTQLWRSDKEPPMVMRYGDIMPNADLANDLFLPPDGVTFKTVGSLEEYAELEKERVLESVKDLRPWEAEPPVEYPLRREPPVFDGATGTYKLSPPPGFTAEEYEEALSRLVLEDRQRQGNRLPGEPTLEERHRALNRSRLTPSQLADLAHYEGRSSSRSEPSPRTDPRAVEPAASGARQSLFDYGNLLLLAVNVVAIATIAWTIVRRWGAAGGGRS